MVALAALMTARWTSIWACLLAIVARAAIASKEAQLEVQQAVIDDGNVFEHLVEAVRVCSLGQITDALFEVGGQYRRNM